MTRNQLHELLQEDQEPFHLQDYINDRRQRLHSRRPDPTSVKSNFTTKLCIQPCFFSSGASPDVVESPGIAKSTKNVIFFQVPPKTAAMLLEASERIRKPKKMDASKRLRSFMKKLKQSSSEKRKKSGEGVEVGVVLKALLNGRENAVSSSTAFIGRSVTLRQNPTFSPEMSEIKIDQNLDFETEFCNRSPFRFVLHNDSYNPQPPSSPSSSSVETEIGKKCAEKDLVKQCGNEGAEKEEDEEHCSPVSVLDPDPYEEDDDVGELHEDDDAEDESSSFDMDCSYANVQRAQERLLEKLSRFESLVELDPLELELRFQEDEQEDFSDGFDVSEEEGNIKETKSLSSSEKRALSYIDQLVKEVLNRPEFATLTRVPAELKKVTKIILTEEELKLIAFDDKSILLERVVPRLASWKEVAGDIRNTIVGHDIKRELDEWARNQDQVTVAAMDIELAIFEGLAEELCEELVF